MNTEQEMRLQFLDEADEYLDAIEMGILAFNPQEDGQKWDTILRSAHSIKGGAAMMGYPSLSEMAHRLEDFLKIIKATRGVSVTRTVEADLLQGVDCLRQGVTIYRSGQAIEPHWLSDNFGPVLDHLRTALGELDEAMENELLSADAGEDMAVFLFQTEVESCLERLEGVLSHPDHGSVREEFRVAAQELGGLGEMLELPNFRALCEEIEGHLAIAGDEDLREIATIALQELKRSRALVLIGQSSAIPTGLAGIGFGASIARDGANLAFDTLTFLDTFPEVVDLENIDSGDLAFLAQFPDDLPLAEEISPPAEPLPFSISGMEIGDPLDQDDQETTDNITRVPARQLEQFADLIGELSLDRNSLNLQLSTVRSLFALLNQRVSILGRANQTLRGIYDRGQEEIKSWGRSAMPTSGHSSRTSPPTADEFDRLEMDRYSELHSLLQELMETIVQIQEVTGDIDTNLDNSRRTGQQITRTSRLLQTQLTRVRMRPFSDLVGRFPRVVRDLNAQYGKEVKLLISGGEILLDRPILDALSDPLLQLLRNAFDHGIEDADTRESLGKPRTGRIDLAATYRGNQTIITLRDDGGGIDTDKIAARAMQMGFTAEDITKLNREDLLNLIFEPGFSTASVVTELSGRGVGMDIVRTRVIELRGRLGVDTRPGEGTTFTITVPFTLSVLRVLLVESGGIFLAFPTNTIEEILVPTAETRHSIEGKSFLDLDGELLPLYNLSQYFRFTRPFLKPETTLHPIINQSLVLLVSHGDRLVALEVSAYYGEQEVTARTVEGGLPLPAGFDRCTILGDGRVVPIVSADELIEAIEQKSTQKGDRATPLSPLTAIARDLVLVVDDSINVRRFLATTLEKAGYRVQQAKDGQEALEKLQEGLSVRAVICDIEMPRLDGYGFLAGVRSRPAYRELPIFMLTSRSGDKHRQLAFDLGATAYFTKPFQEQELLDTLQAYIRVGSGE
jgi:two-component system, chemotaxis family, sensor histidine kinase and response regulator PixL